MEKSVTKPKHVHDWKRAERVLGRGYGRAFSMPVEQCACGQSRVIGTRQEARAAKQEAKREALMLARAAIQAREGRTAKQRKAARELLS